MTHKTNTLMSHCGESRAWPADKMLPKLAVYKATPTQSKIAHKQHYKRSRRYNKIIIEMELTG